jgi:hypothetical protein
MLADLRARISELPTVQMVIDYNAASAMEQR